MFTAQGATTHDLGLLALVLFPFAQSLAVVGRRESERNRFRFPLAFRRDRIIKSPLAPGYKGSVSQPHF